MAGWEMGGQERSLLQGSFTTRPGFLGVWRERWGRHMAKRLWEGWRLADLCYLGASEVHLVESDWC